MKRSIYLLGGCTETAKDPQKVIIKDQDLCLRSLRIGDSQKRYVVESSVLLQEAGLKAVETSGKLKSFFDKLLVR